MYTVPYSAVLNPLEHAPKTITMEYRKLRSGGKMPMVGLGTFQATGLVLETALNKALEAGYRHIDTSNAYKNEHVIGKVVNEWISSGKVTRDELFIVTRLPAYGNRAEEVETYIKTSLQNLQLAYVDMYMIHFSCGLYANGKTELHKMKLDYGTDHIKIWKAMEDQVYGGLTKAIGLSNFNIKQIRRILDNCRIKPDNLQNEIHLYLQEPELVKYCQNNGIIVTAYSPLGTKGVRETMGFTWANETLPEMLENEVLMKVAKKHGKTPAQVLLRHIVQKGIVVIPKSINPRRIMENIRIFDFKLDAEDVECLNGQDVGEEGRIVRFLFIPNVTDHPEYPFAF